MFILHSSEVAFSKGPGVQQSHGAASQGTTQQHVNNTQMREAHRAARTVDCTVLEDARLVGEPMLCLAPRHVIWGALGEGHDRGWGKGG